MNLRIRKQFPEFELYEFSEERVISVETAISEFKDFDWDTENAKSADIIEEHAVPSIRLINERKDVFDICRGDKEKYTITFKNNGLIPRRSMTDVNGDNSVILLLKIFAVGDSQLLIKKLKTMEYHYKSSLIVDILTAFIEKQITRTNRNIQHEEYTYEFKFLPLLYKLTWSIGFFIMNPIIWVFVGSDKPFNLIGFSVMQIIFTLIALPGFLIAFNYWKNNGQWKVLFRKRDNNFIILTPQKKEVFDKRDFIKRIRTENNTNGPWSSFEYNTIVKNDGQLIHLSNILISNSKIDKLFGSLEETPEKKVFPIIRDKKSIAKQVVK